MSQGVVINARFTQRRLTGAQRYAHELAIRLPGAELLAPTHGALGVRGHMWEQFVLPARVGRQLLWSPTNSGPLAVRRQVLTIHDTVSIEHPEWLNPAFVTWYKFLLPRLVRRVSGITTVSRFSQQRIHEALGVPLDEIRVIYNAASSNFVPRVREECRAVTDKLGLSDRPYLLTVGSLEPRKNLRALVDAWSSSAPRLPPEMILVIVGAAGAANIFADTLTLKDSGRIRVLGYVDDDALPYLYASAHAFVYPSIYEGFGLPPIEAMSCGVPTLVGNRTAMPEIVGDGALQCDVENVSVLADNIERLCIDGAFRRNLTARGLARSREFSWERSARELREALAAAQ